MGGKKHNRTPAAAPDHSKAYLHNRTILLTKWKLIVPYEIDILFTPAGQPTGPSVVHCRTGCKHTQGHNPDPSRHAASLGVSPAHGATRLVRRLLARSLSNRPPRTIAALYGFSGTHLAFVYVDVPSGSCRRLPCGRERVFILWPMPGDIDSPRQPDSPQKGRTYWWIVGSGRRL